MFGFSPIAMKAAQSALEIGQASAVTLGQRLPMLTIWPTFDSMREIERMVFEKMEAAVESGFAASRATQALMTRAALGHADADDIADGLLSIAIAASDPVRRRVKANAKRLTRKRPPRRT